MLKNVITAALMLAPAALAAQTAATAGTAGSAASAASGDFSLSSGTVYGGQGYNYGYNVAVDSVSSGGPYVYVRGQSDSGGMLARYSPSGVMLSSATLPAYFNGNPVTYSCLAVDYSGNVYAAGYSWDNTFGKSVLVVNVYGPSLAAAPSEYSYAFSEGSFYQPSAWSSPSGAVYFAGQMSGRIGLVRFSGSAVSSAAVFGDNYYPNGLGADAAGNVYVSGMGGTPYLPAVFKFDQGLNYLGYASLPAGDFSSGGIYTQGAAVSPAGDVYLPGNVYVNGGGDCTLFKFSGMVYVSSAVFDSGGYDYCNSAAVSPSGKVYLSGYSQNGGSGDFLTLQLDSALNFETFYTMDGGAYDYAYSVAVDSAGSVYVTGNSDRYNGYSYASNMATVRYGAEGVGNRAPILYWAGSPDYNWSGVYPQEGISGTLFKYAVKYTDPDNDSPASGYPRVRVYLNGAEVSGSPFALAKVSGSAPRTGEIYGTAVELAPGSNYTYTFEGMDSNASPLPAIGYPVTSVSGGPSVGAGFQGGFAQAGGLKFDVGAYIAPLAVAVDTVTAGGPFVYSLGVVNRYGSAAATSGTAAGGANATSGTAATAGTAAGAGISGNYVILKTTVPAGTSSATVFVSTGAGGSLGTPADLALDQGGNVYVLGGYIDESWMPATGINKFDRSMTWVSSASYTWDHARPVAFVIDPSTNIYVLGSYYNMSSMSQDMIVAKFDRFMTLQTTAAFGAAAAGTAFYDTPADIALDHDGNIFITGYYSDTSGTNYGSNWVTAKFSPSMVFVSSAVFNGMGQTSYDVAASVAAGPDGSVFVTGYSNNGASNDMLTVKYGNDLSFRGLAFFNAGTSESASAVVTRPDGGVYVAGSGDSYLQQYGNSSGTGFVALKYDSDLVLRSSAVFTLDGYYNAGKAVALDASGAAYVTGGFNEYSNGYYMQGLRTIRRQLPDTSRQLTVAIGTTTPRGGVTVGLIPFPAAGTPDAGLMTVGRTGTDGKFSAPLRPALNYLVAISSPGFSPTVKDQINDAAGRFMVNLLQPATKQYFLNPVAASSLGSTLTVRLSGLVPGYSLMGEAFFTQTGEGVAYGVMTATAAYGTLELFNVPPSAAGMLSVTVSVPGRLAVTQPVPFALPSEGAVQADMSAAMPPQGTYQAGVSTVTAFTGFVGDSQGNALKDVKVQISRTAMGCMSNCQPVFQSVSNTDSSGRFSFQTIDGAASYNVYLYKKGYKVSSLNEALPMLNAWYTLEKATYSLRGYLRVNGVAVPYATLSAWGDCRSWSGTDSYASKCSQAENTAVTDGDGYFMMEGLSDGNLSLSVNRPIWNELNSGPDGISRTADDIRITVSSAGATGPSLPVGNPCLAGRAWVLNSTGACKGVQPYVFNLESEASATGLIKGYVTFTTTYTVSAASPLYIDKSSAVVVMASENCNGDCQNRRMGMAAISGTLLSAATSYAIQVASGTTYWTSVLSNEWGKVSSFGSDISLESTGTVSMDFSLVRSGSLTCKIKLPDGTLYLPSGGSQVNIEASGQNVSADEGTSIDTDGAARFDNLPAGIYDVTLKPQTTSFIWPVQTLEDVNIVAGRNTDLVFSLEEGLAVQPQIFSLPEISTPAWSYIVIPLPSGTKMNQKKVTDLFFGDNQFSFSYSTATGVWETRYMAPGQYDFSLLLGTRYNPGGGGDEPQSFHQFANFIGKAKNVSVQTSDSNPNLGTAAQPIPVEILGSIGQGSISGTVKGSKIFTGRDYDKIFGNFESEIQSLIPAMMLYDTAGDFRGFAHAMPSQAMIGPFEAAIQAKSSAAIAGLLSSDPLAYTLWGLPPGSYTAVFANPNYPPVPVSVALPADELKNFDFDAQPLAVGSITGVVRSSDAAGTPLPNASVYLKHRTIEKLAATDASGAFSFTNLPQGIYRLEVTHDGFVPAGQKTSLAGSLTGSDGASFEFYMQPSTSVITGSVRIGGGLGGSSAKAGVKVVAYDETMNALSPSAYLPRIQALTDDSGAFELGGIWPGHLYNITAIYPGKPVGSASVTAQPGVTAMDGPIVLTDANPQVTVKIRKSQDSDRKVDVIIKSPKALVRAPRCAYNLGSAYDAASAVSLSLRLDPDNTYVGKFTVSPGRTYNIHVEAFDDSMTDDFLKMVKDVVYDQTSEARTEQYIQETASAGGEVELDSENEEYSGIELDVGSLTVSSGTADLSGLVGGFFSALPSVRTVKTAKGNASLESAIQSLMASEVYNFDLSNVQPNKPFTLNLKYDKEKASNTGALRIYQYDSADGSWKEIPGNYTVDPMTGVVSVDVSSLDLAYEGSGGITTPLGRKRFGMSAVSGGRYRPSSTSSSSQSGKFAVFTAKPPTGTAYTGAAFEFYNLPNPFSLKAKTVNVSSDGGAALSAGAYTTRGTLIKYHMPPARNGGVKFVIFNVAGEKVRDIDDGYRAGGQVYYSEWDGKNDAGADCASGVYFMLAYVDGKKAGGAHKMALIK